MLIWLSLRLTTLRQPGPSLSEDGILPGETTTEKSYSCWFYIEQIAPAANTQPSYMLLQCTHSTKVEAVRNPSVHGASKTTSLSTFFPDAEHDLKKGYREGKKQEKYETFHEL